VINSNYFTVGVKNGTNYKSFDACHALVIPDLGVLPSVAAKSLNAILTSKKIPNRVTKLL
jgi:hypothetical protein